jgi:hypothetical protein
LNRSLGGIGLRSRLAAQILLELSSLIQVRAHSELLVLWLEALQLLGGVVGSSTGGAVVSSAGGAADSSAGGAVVSSVGGAGGLST